LSLLQVLFLPHPSVLFCENLLMTHADERHEYRTTRKDRISIACGIL
jgi:hypothetical protein